MPSNSDLAGGVSHCARPRSAIVELAACGNIAALVPDFRVTKLRVPVKVWVADKVQGGDVFLTPVAASHDGGETLADLLNGRDPFLPVERDGCLSCYPLDTISVASVKQDAGEIPPVEIAPFTQHLVRVTLLSGRALTGTIRYSRHPDSSRLVDYLNAAPRFIAVHQGAEIAFVNRQHVASIALESEAVPLRPRLKAVARRSWRRSR